jgi:uncharacterized membrane protein YgcG
MVKRISLVLAVALLWATTGVAGAQPYPPQACTNKALSVSTTTVTPGQPITVSGCGFAPDAPVRITFESIPVLLATLLSVPSPTESFATTVNVPADAPTGAHTLKATGTGLDGTPLVLSVPLQVMEAGGGPAATSGGGSGGGTGTSGGSGSGSGGNLSRTGSGSTVPLARLGLALVLLGAGTVAVVRRRRTGRPGKDPVVDA